MANELSSFLYGYYRFVCSLVYKLNPWTIVLTVKVQIDHGLVCNHLIEACMLLLKHWTLGAGCDSNLSQLRTLGTGCNSGLSQHRTLGAGCNSDLSQCWTLGAGCDSGLSQHWTLGAGCNSGLSQY